MKKAELAKELLTTAELMTVLHRQGFDSVNERGALHPRAGRHIRVKGVDPPFQRQAHDEVMRTLKDLSAKLDALAQARGQA